MATGSQAAPAWSSQDDLDFVRSFVQSYTARAGSPPSEQLVQASLSCHRHYYNQAAAQGMDVNAAANHSLSSCRHILSRSAAASQGRSRSGTLFNSSGDASLSTGSNGCMYYSSGPYSFSNC